MVVDKMQWIWVSIQFFFETVMPFWKCLFYLRTQQNSQFWKALAKQGLQLQRLFHIWYKDILQNFQNLNKTFLSQMSFVSSWGGVDRLLEEARSNPNANSASPGFQCSQLESYIAGQSQTIPLHHHTSFLVKQCGTQEQKLGFPILDRFPEPTLHLGQGRHQRPSHIKLKG